MTNSWTEDRLGGARDDFYHLLMETHEGLSDEQSQRLNARLVLMLANEVGDIDSLRRLFKAAVEVGR